MVSIGCCSEQPILIGPMSADQHKQIGIWGGARSFQLRGGSIEQNENVEKYQEINDRSEKNSKDS
jgi:hypothetical protein